jgi:hypothetical protein
MHLKKKARRGVRDRAGTNAKPPLKGNLAMKKLPHSRRQLQFPDLFDWAASQDTVVVNDPRIRWVIRRCRVSRFAAKAIIENAGFRSR